MARWIPIKNSDGKGGVRYREHATRKHGIMPDRYYMLTYWWRGKSTADGVGWASDGWTPSKCFNLLAEIKQNQATGDGPCTLKEMREIAEETKAAEKQKRATEAKQTFPIFFKEIFLPDAEVRWKPETLRKAREHVKNWIAPVCGELPMRELSIVHANRIKSNLSAAGSSPRQMQYVFRTFAMVWGAAIDYGYVNAQCPTKSASFRLPKVDNERKKYLSREEEKLLFEKVAERSLNAYRIAVVAIDTGMRFSEIAALSWDCVDFKDKSIVILDTKGYIDRIVPMTTRVTELLRFMRETGLVFPNTAGGVQKSVPSSFIRAVADSGLNSDVRNKKMRVSFYTLRHTFASRLVQAGVDIYRIQRLLGHSTIDMTQRYSKLTQDNLRDAVGKIESPTVSQLKKRGHVI